MRFRRIKKIWKEWILQQRIYALIGLGGVNKNEIRTARLWGKFFSYFVVIISILLLLQWQWELLNELSEKEMLLYNLSIWCYFFIQFSILIFVVKDRNRFLLQNWLLPVIILAGLFFIFDYEPVAIILNHFRPILAVLLLIPSITLLLKFFIDGKLRTTLLATAIIVVIFGVLASGVDPNIKTAWDGIWWAVATVTTIGYGDVVPSSELGRIIGIGLMVLGLGVFVIITANILALTLVKETKKIKEEERKLDEVFKDIQDMKTSQKEMMTIIKFLKKKVDSNKDKTT